MEVSNWPWESFSAPDGHRIHKFFKTLKPSYTSSDFIQYPGRKVLTGQHP